MSDHKRQLAALEAECSKAAADVLTERRRQVEVEGWTPEHDDGHALGEMVLAAISYLLAADCLRSVGHVSRDVLPHYWPWAKAWWKPGSIRRMLVKAAALIIAEIERLDRAAASDAP